MLGLHVLSVAESVKNGNEVPKIYPIEASDTDTVSTTETDMVSYNGKIYNWYPRIDFDVPSEKIASKFLDSIQFSNSYLPGLDRKICRHKNKAVEYKPL